MTDLETLLSESLADDRWALPARLDIASLRAAGRRRQARRRTATATLAVAALLAGAGGLLAVQREPDRLGYAGSGPSAQPAPTTTPVPGSRPAPHTPVPGITPAFSPTRGSDWLLTVDQARTFASVHVTPSPCCGQSVVPSHAPLTARTLDLVADGRAGLPPGADVVGEQDPGGQPAVEALHVHLADGTPVEVERAQLQVPLAAAELENRGSTVPSLTVRDVPGSSAALLSMADYGYGYGFQDWQGDPGAQLAMTVTAGGVTTRWASPVTLPLATLQGWAVAAEQHAAARR